MPPKKVHEIDLIRPDQVADEVACLMCGMDYSDVDYETLFDAKKLAYFDVSCLNFWDSKEEEFKKDEVAVVCHGCLRKAVLKIGNNKKVVKIVIKDGKKTYTCNYYPDKDSNFFDEM